MRNTFFIRFLLAISCSLVICSCYLPTDDNLDKRKILPPVDSKKNVINSKKIIGYLPIDYRYQHLDDILAQNVITHLNVAFVWVKKDIGLFLPGAKFQERLNDIVAKCHKLGIKVLISVRFKDFKTPKDSGYVQGYPDIIFNSKDRKILARRLSTFVTDNNLDGLDIDYEALYWDSRDAKKQPYMDSLYSDISKVLSKDKILSAAVTPYNNLKTIYSKNLPKYLDYVNLMIYDNRVFSSKGPVQHSSFEDLKNGLRVWEHTFGFSKDRIIGGVPFYGNCWAGNKLIGAKTYRDIVNSFKGHKKNLAKKRNYMVKGDTTFVYNGTKIISQKAKYIIDNNYGGIMIWELGQDLFEDCSSLLLEKVGDKFRK